MNVLHVIPSLKKGGAERLVIDICRNLQANKDIRVLIVTLYPENDYEFLTKELDIIHCNSYFHFSISKKSSHDMSHYGEILAEFQPDIIHSHLFEADFFVHQKLFHGATYFTHLHDNMIQFQNINEASLLTKARWTNYFEKIYLLKKYKRCHQSFIANSQDTYDFFKLHLPVSFHQAIHLMNNAIDLTQFNYLERTGISNSLHLVMAGSLVLKKNQLFLLDVIKYLLRKKISVKLDILGDGPLRSNIEDQIKRFNLQEVVKMKGIIDDVVEYYTRANIYVHSATYEPFGLAIVEAMATGLPVVCLNANGNKGIVEQGVNGFMLEEQDATLFAEKILEITLNSENYKAFSIAARKKAEQYDLKAYVQNLLIIYIRTIQA